MAQVCSVGKDDMDDIFLNQKSGLQMHWRGSPRAALLDCPAGHDYKCHLGFIQPWCWIPTSQKNHLLPYTALWHTNYLKAQHAHPPFTDTFRPGCTSTCIRIHCTQPTCKWAAARLWLCHRWDLHSLQHVDKWLCSSKLVFWLVYNLFSILEKNN